MVFSFRVCVATVSLVASIGAHASSVQPLDLDGVAANGAESQCEVSVNTSGPITVVNTVVNRTGGDAFDFAWPSAGPGGFTASIPGPTTGSPAKTLEWTWTTSQPLVPFSGTNCSNDICFGRTSGPDTLPGTVCSLACLADGITMALSFDRSSGTVSLTWPLGTGPFIAYRSTSARGVDDGANALPMNSTAGTTPPTATSPYSDAPPPGITFFYKIRGSACLTRKACSTGADCSVPGDGFCVSRGPFQVPGRSLYTSSVTVSSASLTSSFIRTFSPTTTLFWATSTANPGGVAESLTNNTGADITVTTPGLPLGCCPASEDPHQLNCNGNCVHYLWDESNCGACGNVCVPGDNCSYGVCIPPCGEGQTFCGESCVSLYDDPSNCGECGNTCGEGNCCIKGTCTPPCDEGLELCGDQCVNLANDRDNCNYCNSDCSPDTCCQGRECTALLCDEGLSLCDGQCVDVQQDNGHCGNCGTVCGPSECCTGGLCLSLCNEGDVVCSGACTSLAYDDNHCGDCDTACGEGSCCVRGGCAPLVCGQDETQCPDGCTDTQSDPNNCGQCGAACGEGSCCSGGGCSSECGSQSSPHPQHCPNGDPPVPVGRVCPGGPPPVAGSCPNGAASVPEPSHCAVTALAAHGPVGDPNPRLGDRPVNEAPVCTVEPKTTIIPSDGNPVTICRPGGRLFREVPTSIKVCGDLIPGVDGECAGGATKVSVGTFNRLLADPTIPVGDAYVTPFAVHVVSDTSNDGLLQPGESGSLVVDLLNAGPRDITIAKAALAAPAIDFMGDGVFDLPAIAVGAPLLVSYGTIFGTPDAVNCTPTPLRIASNSPAFPVTVPANHPGDTSRPMVLSVSGRVNDTDFSMDVPLSLGIGGRCDAAAHNRTFDGLDGLLSPMAKLVPAAEPVQFPTDPFLVGSTRPLKLRVLCGNENLTDATVDPPEIIGLSVERPNGTNEVLDIRLLNLDRDGGPNANDPFFRFNTTLIGGHWKYNMRTALLGPGRFTLTIAIGKQRNFVTGFVLQ